MITKKNQTKLDAIKMRLSDDYIETKTSIFNDFPGVYELDEVTRDIIKHNLRLWINSRILTELEEIK